MQHAGARDGDDEGDGDLPRLLLVVDAVARDRLPVGVRRLQLRERGVVHSRRVGGRREECLGAGGDGDERGKDDHANALHLVGGERGRQAAVGGVQHRDERGADHHGEAGILQVTVGRSRAAEQVDRLADRRELGRQVEEHVEERGERHVHVDVGAVAHLDVLEEGDACWDLLAQDGRYPRNEHQRNDARDHVPKERYRTSKNGRLGDRENYPRASAARKE